VSEEQADGRWPPILLSGLDVTLLAAGFRFREEIGLAVRLTLLLRGLELRPGHAQRRVHRGERELVLKDRSGGSLYSDGERVCDVQLQDCRR
jgi:hypothetical protein